MILATLIANAPAEVHALFATAHAALHGKAALQSEFNDIVGAIAAGLGRAQELMGSLGSADATAQQHVAAFTKALTEHALTVPPTTAADTAAPPTPAAPAA